jgi:energy-coupling factor transport system permease protein
MTTSPPDQASVDRPVRERPAPIAVNHAERAATPENPGVAGRYRRSLHPAAWWTWSLGLAVAASKTTNPLVLALLLASAAVVVAARRTDAPWAMSFRLYLFTGLFVVIMRVAYRIVLGGGPAGAHVLLHLPGWNLPSWASGIALLGPVTATSLLSAVSDGMRLATLIICVGAANTLANPKRLLKAVPSALYELGTALIVAVSVFPQLAESARRIRRARALRGGPPPGRQAIRAILVPLLEDALDRSLLLAAAMDSRGYGRHGTTPRRSLRITSVLMMAGLAGICVGTYGTLDDTAPRYLGTPLLLFGVLLAGVGLWQAGRRVHRTSYRPDRWHIADVLVALCGPVTAILVSVAVHIDPAAMAPSFVPLEWPSLPTAALLGVVTACLPAWIAPPPPERNGGR